MNKYGENIQALFKIINTIDADFIVDFRAFELNCFYLRFSKDTFVYINPKHNEALISIKMEQIMISLNIKHGEFNTILNNVAEILNNLTPKDSYFLNRDLFSKQNGQFYLRDYQTDVFAKDELEGPIWVKLEIDGLAE